MSAWYLPVLIAGGVLAWLWNDGLRTRETVLRACRRACDDLGVQMLDQTVALRRLGLGRDARGRLHLRREYGFEFSLTGDDRRSGSAICLGPWIERLQLEHPDGSVLIQ
ncbi:MAG: DUF3301 domain-containing protein [Ectothiorhodospiraceae bacterium]|jgi:hypothetical protein|nr:DUF3301 domain-containing protein [Ectothiorhodospiraceae bacterium]